MGLRRWSLALFALGLSGCSVDPGAPLIPTPQPRATVAPWQAPERTADGFPNILADPVVVGGGLPRPQKVVAAEMDALAATRNRAQAQTRAIPRTDFAGELSRQAKTSVADARAAIEASGRGGEARGPMPDPDDVIAEARRAIVASGSRPGEGATPDAPAAAPPAASADETLRAPRPIDPAAPLPRAVGTPP